MIVDVYFQLKQKTILNLILLIQYTACYSKEIQCFVAIDCLAREQLSYDVFYPISGENIDKNLDFYRRLKENSRDDLTFDKAVEM